MKSLIVTIFAMLFLIGALAGVYYFGFYDLKKNSATSGLTPTPTILLGGDEDEYGCKISAGFSWCELKQKCLREWEEPCGSAVSTDEDEKLKTEIKSAIVAKRGSGAANLSITVSKIEGNYAQGGASEPDMGGGMWFAAKVGEAWQLVWDGNGIIACSDLTAYPEFPVSMIPQCYDQATGDMVVRTTN